MKIWDTVDSIATDYELTERDSILGRNKKLLSTPQDLDRLWDTPSLLSNGYRELFPQG
jgi:hypothetical protein